jgi:hypothetical protein
MGVASENCMGVASENCIGVASENCMGVASDQHPLSIEKQTRKDFTDDSCFGDFLTRNHHHHFWGFCV